MTLDEYMQVNRNAIFRLWIYVQLQKKTTPNSSIELWREKPQNNICLFVCFQ